MRTRKSSRGVRLARGAAALISASAVGLSAPMAAAAPGGGEEEGFGNNLAMPVLWAESAEAGARPVLRGTGSQSADLTLDPTAFETVDGVRAYLQATANTWQSENADAATSGLALTADAKVPVSLVDWGDNLAQDPQHPHMLRVETRLLQDVSTLTDASPADNTNSAGMTAYSMLKTNDVSGVGEMWGVVSADSGGQDQAVAVQSDEAFLFTSKACLTIERIDDADKVAWDAASRSWTGDVSVAKCVGEVTEGPGGYGAEVTISGGMTYGYVWRVPDYPAGLYRLTFSLLPESGADLTDGTGLYVSEETEEPPAAAEPAAAAEEEEGGGTTANVPVIDPANNLTYIDVGIAFTHGKPTRPVNLTATREIDATTLTWDPPVSEGDSAITEYVITGSGAGKTVPEKRIPADAPRSAAISGLTGGEGYDLSVAAVNSSGTGDTATINVVPRVAPVIVPPPSTPPTSPPKTDDPVKEQAKVRAQRRITLKVRARANRAERMIKVSAHGDLLGKHKGKWKAEKGIVKIYFNPVGPAKARLIKKVRVSAENGYTLRFHVHKGGSVFATCAQDANHLSAKSRVVAIRMAR